MLRELLLAAALCAATSAQAQIKAEHPRFCVMSVGPAQMMFSAFQENKTDEIFCRNVPAPGPTMIILDARSDELRDMNIEVRVIRDVGQKDWRDELDANTVAAIPPKKYLERRGTTNFTHDFSDEGNYIAVVRATSDDGMKEYVGEYRFSVGDSTRWIMAGGALAALGVVGYGLWRRNSRSATAARPRAGPRDREAKPKGSTAR